MARLRRRSLPPAPAADGGNLLEGSVRLGRRTKELVKHLRTGEVAVIDHRDLDRISAEELVNDGVAAVVNVAPFTTGSYPNAGPLLLARAGIRLVEAIDAPLFELLSDGDRVVVDGGRISADGALVAEGRQLDVEEVALALERQREEIGQALEAFAENTIAHIREERDLLSGRIDFPNIATGFRDRHVLIVVRGTDHKKDLKALRAYIRDVKPLLIGVDGGVQAIIDQGMKPDVILGDMDSASDDALAGGAELIVHGYPDGRAPGQDRLQSLDLDHKVVPAPGTSQDVAMLLAAEKGAALIVMVGAHFNLIEFLDRNRAGMASTFLTRLRVGEILVDAKGVSRLYRPGPGPGILAVVGAAVVVLAAVVVAVSPVLDDLLDLLVLKLRVLLGL